MPNFPLNLVIHHTAVSREKNPEQFDAVKKYHIGKNWSDIGYHYFIEPSGAVKTGRSEDTTGAHCSQKLMNYRSLGICLTGNFDSEDPTPEQLQALARLVQKLRTKYEIPANQVFAHRFFANYKSCPGVRFTDKMIEEIANGTFEIFVPPSWSNTGVEWANFEKIITKITGEPVPDYRLAAILHNFYECLKKEFR